MPRPKYRRTASERPRVVCYCRVSSAGQAESGLSLAAQREKVIAYAALYGLDVVEVIEDAGVSAKTLERAGLARALALLGSGAADGLVIAKLDRLSRSLRDWADLIDGFFGDRARTPASLYSVGDSIDTTSAAGRLVLNMLMSVAQWEREVIGERTATALDVKRARNEMVGPHAPIGMRRADDGVHVAADEREAAAVARVRELRASGHSIREIAAALNAEQVPARGSRWHPTTVARVLGRLEEVTAA